MKDIATLFCIYLLYPMDRDDEANFYKLLQDCVNVGTEIFAYLIDWEKMDGLPKSTLYVPADHEAFTHYAYKGGLITKEQIDSINCEIVKECDLLILFGGYQPPTLGDIPKELYCAKEKKIPIYTMPDLSPRAMDALKLAIKLIIRAGD